MSRTGRSEVAVMQRGGFTSIELFVVLTAIGMLGALLLPAVLQARESARSTQCRNNLWQIGIALENFHAAQGAYPPGWQGIERSADGSVLRPLDLGCLWAWAAFLLPQLEQTPLSESLGVYGVADPPAPGDRGDVRLASFLCPSDAGGSESGWGLYRAIWSDDGALSTELVKGYSKSNYVAVRGQTGTLHDFEESPDVAESKTRGIFGRDTQTRHRDIRDGLSQTLAIGEREMTRDLKGDAPRGATWLRNAGELIANVTDENATTLARGTAPDAARSSEDCHSEQGMLVGNYCDTRSVAGSTGPGAPMNRTSDGFSSLHPGGAFFLLADGAVRFVSENIEPHTYGRLGAMADGEVLGEY